MEKLKVKVKSLNTRVTGLNKEKRISDEKCARLSEAYNKMLVNSEKPLNSIQYSSVCKESNLIKELKGYSSTEKLVETLKNGFNESVRELIFEISALKDFIVDFNSELGSLVTIEFGGDGQFIDDYFKKVSFLENSLKVKEIVRFNLSFVKDAVKGKDLSKIQLSKIEIDDPAEIEECSGLEESKNEVSELEAMKQKWMNILND